MELTIALLFCFVVLVVISFIILWSTWPLVLKKNDFVDLNEEPYIISDPGDEVDDHLYSQLN